MSPIQIKASCNFLKTFSCQIEVLFKHQINSNINLADHWFCDDFFPTRPAHEIYQIPAQRRELTDEGLVCFTFQHVDSRSRWNMSDNIKVWMVINSHVPMKLTNRPVFVQRINKLSACRSVPEGSRVYIEIKFKLNIVFQHSCAVGVSMVIWDRTRMRSIPKSVHYTVHDAVKQIFHSINIDLCTKCKQLASVSASIRANIFRPVNYFSNLLLTTSIVTLDKLLFRGCSAPHWPLAAFGLCVRFFFVLSPLD